MARGRRVVVVSATAASALDTLETYAELVAFLARHGVMVTRKQLWIWSLDDPRNPHRVDPFPMRREAESGKRNRVRAGRSDVAAWIRRRMHSP